MYGDPKKNCCVKNCTTKADLKEQFKYYCCEHYLQFFLKMSLEEITIKNNKESGNSAATK